MDFAIENMIRVLTRSYFERIKVVPVIYASNFFFLQEMQLLMKAYRFVY